MGFKKCYLSIAVDETDRFALGLSPYGPDAPKPFGWLVGWLGVASGPLPNILVTHKCRGFQNSVRVFSAKVERPNQI